MQLDVPPAQQPSSADGTPREVFQHAPEGLAVIDADARFVAANPAARALCGLPPGDVAGIPSPFPVPGSTPAAGGATETTVEWRTGPGRREFAYLVDRVPDRDEWVVSFRDVTVSRQQQRRLAAIAKAASSVATKRSLVGTLEALAREVARADSLAGVQVMTVNSTGDRLHVMGAAGFVRTPDFFDKLMECRARGARLVMLEALESRTPVVVGDRYDAVMQDPAWAPLHELMGSPRWGWFASVPLLARREPVGILNAYFAPGQIVGDAELEFLLAMAEQAAMAVDHAALLERERDVASREERQRLARDLHDSVVQQVFSMMMQARSLGVLVERGLPPAPEKVAQVADDLSTSAEDVLADLRGMVVELRPATGTARGLGSALRSLVDTTGARTGLDASLEVDDPADELAGLDPDLVEDVYRIIAEAVHNSVKHASAATMRVRVAVTPHGSRRRLVAEVIDDGCGLGDEPRPHEEGPPSGGFGMTAMQERASRWGGVVRVRDLPSGGTRVQLTLPLLASLPTAPVPTTPTPTPHTDDEEFSP
ncbi:GAF domain-containing sensor histidine kinase [Blastococcus sp. LR1]|uniref:GAF domain-containing sensor histidine kinase n=1 Tax=Blastococcus sp. LR1 TaxID=2877000 RepID=UPI001CCF4DF2|nr:GAF domain-containing sensor histidine kinase [Blastococcus sp. LR1]MCA0145334.1 histidine kinase [Blastococcus sp. LR1]